MSELFKPFGKNYTYTESEMDQMGEILLVAEEIKEDDKLCRLVQKHLAEKGEKITKIQDLRDLANADDGDNEARKM